MRRRGEFLKRYFVRLKPPPRRVCAQCVCVCLKPFNTRPRPQISRWSSTPLWWFFFFSSFATYTVVTFCNKTAREREREGKKNNNNNLAEQMANFQRPRSCKTRVLFKRDLNETLLLKNGSVSVCMYEIILYAYTFCIEKRRNGVKKKKNPRIDNRV